MQKKLFSFEPGVCEGESTCPNPQNEYLLGQGTEALSRVVMGRFWGEMFVVVNTVSLGGGRCGVRRVQRVSVAPYSHVEVV